ncbi:MAG: Spo0B domain-containing protein [Paenibacillaceae bacterium]|nr:Spo0B domain-containing protein [Paenibacillaceae bacterium]
MDQMAKQCDLLLEQHHQHDRWLGMVRSQWHEWANALQVLLGYVQLDRGDQAQKYILQLAQKLHDSQAFVDIPPVSVSSFLLSYVAMPLPYAVALQGEHYGCVAAVHDMQSLPLVIRTFLHRCEEAFPADGSSSLNVRLTSAQREWALTVSICGQCNPEVLYDAICDARARCSVHDVRALCVSWHSDVSSQCAHVRWSVLERADCYVSI